MDISKKRIAALLDIKDGIDLLSGTPEIDTMMDTFNNIIKKASVDVLNGTKDDRITAIRDAIVIYTGENYNNYVANFFQSLINLYDTANLQDGSYNSDPITGINLLLTNLVGDNGVMLRTTSSFDKSITLFSGEGDETTINTKTLMDTVISTFNTFMGTTNFDDEIKAVLYLKETVDLRASVESNVNTAGFDAAALSKYNQTISAIESICAYNLKEKDGLDSSSELTAMNAFFPLDSSALSDTGEEGELKAYITNLNTIYSKDRGKDSLLVITGDSSVPFSNSFTVKFNSVDDVVIGANYISDTLTSESVRRNAIISARNTALSDLTYAESIYEEKIKQESYNSVITSADTIINLSDTKEGMATYIKTFCGIIQTAAMKSMELKYKQYMKVADVSAYQTALNTANTNRNNFYTNVETTESKIDAYISYINDLADDGIDRSAAVTSEISGGARGTLKLKTGLSQANFEDLIDVTTPGIVTLSDTGDIDITEYINSINDSSAYGVTKVLTDFWEVGGVFDSLSNDDKKYKHLF